MSDALPMFFTTLATIPGRVLNNFPAFFGIAAASYVGDMVLSVIPQVGGTAGRIERAVLFGAQRTIEHATWDAYNMGHGNGQNLLTNAFGFFSNMPVVSKAS